MTKDDLLEWPRNDRATQEEKNEFQENKHYPRQQ